ncbi:hypothetical protein NPIL_571771, partial [Nephila pilipes]
PTKYYRPIRPKHAFVVEWRGERSDCAKVFQMYEMGKTMNSTENEAISDECDSDDENEPVDLANCDVRKKKK